MFIKGDYAQTRASSTFLRWIQAFFALIIRKCHLKKNYEEKSYPYLSCFGKNKFLFKFIKKHSLDSPQEGAWFFMLSFVHCPLYLLFDKIVLITEWRNVMKHLDGILHYDAEYGVLLTEQQAAGIVVQK